MYAPAWTSITRRDASRETRNGTTTAYRFTAQLRFRPRRSARSSDHPAAPRSVLARCLRTLSSGRAGLGMAMLCPGCVGRRCDAGLCTGSGVSVRDRWGAAVGGVCPGRRAAGDGEPFVEQHICLRCRAARRAGPGSGVSVPGRRRADVRGVQPVRLAAGGVELQLQLGIGVPRWVYRTADSSQWLPV